jgi:polysaccharide deacetylase family protein (PEP-CTERM system associated)
MPGSLIVSIDVEDWPQSTWDHSLEITERAAANTERVLEILAARKTRATLFVLGKLAERFPELVRRMAAAGHEIASHGYGHVETFLKTPEEFREDVRRSKELLEDLTGQAVRGYRAPDFSIRGDTLWGLEMLAEVGYEYDSSIFPILQTRYGIDGWPTDPVRVRLPSGRTIVELPIATLDLFGRRLPVAGGGYHRLLPWPAIRWAIARSLVERKTFMAYCHPYEFDYREFAELDLAIPLKTRLHQGLGRRGFRAKFEGMLAGFPAETADAVALEREWPELDLDRWTASRQPNAPETAAVPRA